MTTQVRGRRNLSRPRQGGLRSSTFSKFSMRKKRERSADLFTVPRMGSRYSCFQSDHYERGAPHIGMISRSFPRRSIHGFNGFPPVSLLLTRSLRLLMIPPISLRTVQPSLNPSTALRKGPKRHRSTIEAVSSSVSSAMIAARRVVYTYGCMPCSLASASAGVIEWCMASPPTTGLFNFN